MPLPAAIAAGVSLLPAAASAVGSWWGQERANRQNREMAREQMAFQERMSNTSYQRAMEDMRIAGINPMLAYMQGGASSPGGSTATIQDTIGPAVSSAQHGSRLRKDIQLIQEQIQATRAQAFSSRMQGEKAFAEAQVAQLERTTPDGLPGYTNWQLRRNAELGLMRSQAAQASSLLPVRGLASSLARGLRPLVDFAGEGFQRYNAGLRGLQTGADEVRRALWDTGSRAFGTLRRTRRDY